MDLWITNSAIQGWMEPFRRECVFNMVHVMACQNLFCIIILSVIHFSIILSLPHVKCSFSVQVSTHTYKHHVNIIQSHLTNISPVPCDGSEH